MRKNERLVVWAFVVAMGIKLYAPWENVKEIAQAVVLVTIGMWFSPLAWKDDETRDTDKSPS